MFRRFVLVGVLVVVKQGTVEQLAYGTLAALVYFAIQLNCSPFRNLADDFLAMLCSLGLTAFLFCCVFAKYAELTDNADFVTVMSYEQRTDYYMPHVTISQSLF